MVGRARELLFEKLEELAAVVEIGQRIDRRELVDFFVIARLDRRAIHELEHAAADRDVIAVLELGLDDRLVVEERLVGRIQILDAKTRRLAPDLRMLARHAALQDLELALRPAADHQRLIADVDALAETLALQHDEAGRLAAVGVRARGPDGTALRRAVVLTCAHRLLGGRAEPEQFTRTTGAFGGLPGTKRKSGCR